MQKPYKAAGSAGYKMQATDFSKLLQDGELASYGGWMRG
jgi:hypothetical protein